MSNFIAKFLNWYLIIRNVFIDLIIIAIGVKGVSPSPSLILKNLQTGPSKIVVGVVVVANVMLDALRARCEAIVS